MSKKKKLLDKMRRNPRNIRFEELENLLLAYGFEKRAGKGSHAIYKIRGKRPLTIPRKRPFLKPIYVKLALQMIEQLEG